MYGSLGYINNPKRTPTRDATFFGSSGHPSRRDLMGAKRVDAGSLTSVETHQATQQQQQQLQQLQQAPPQQQQPFATHTNNNSSMRSALVERRCAFLEAEAKRHTHELAEMRSQLRDATTVAETMTARTLEDAPWVESAEDESSNPTATTNATRNIPSDTQVQLTYPMRRTFHGGITRVWMRMREVCPRTATVSYGWLLLFEENADASSPDRVYVSEFR